MTFKKDHNFWYVGNHEYFRPPRDRCCVKLSNDRRRLSELPVFQKFFKVVFSILFNHLNSNLEAAFNSLNDKTVYDNRRLTLLFYSRILFTLPSIFHFFDAC